MNQNCNLIKCIHNLHNSISLCLNISELEYDYLNVCWLNQGITPNNFNCTKYKIK